MRSVAKIEEIPAVAGTSPYRGQRLESWKEIAVYLKRSVRCVQRWERGEALPVYRLLHKSHATVYAYGPELAAWHDRRSRKTIAAKFSGTQHHVVLFVSKEGIVLRQDKAGRTSWTW